MLCDLTVMCVCSVPDIIVTMLRAGEDVISIATVRLLQSTSQAKSCASYQLQYPSIDLLDGCGTLGMLVSGLSDCGVGDLVQCTCRSWAFTQPLEPRAFR
jgi:hypothetical protein